MREVGFQQPAETSILRQVVICRLVMILSVCLVGTAARSAGNQTGPVLVLTFLELRVDAVDRGRSLLRRYEESLRRGGQGVGRSM